MRSHRDKPSQTLSASSSPRNRPHSASLPISRRANWLDPFTPTSEIKSSQGTARQILDHYHDATLKAVNARNQNDRHDAELSLESAHLKLQINTIKVHHTNVPNPTTTQYIFIHTAQNTE